MSIWRYHDDILDALPNAVLLLDGASLQICYANPAVTQLTGYTPEELAQRTLADLCLPVERQRLDSTLRGLRAGQVLRLQRRLEVRDDCIVADIIIHATPLNGELSLLIDLRPLGRPGEADHAIEHQPHQGTLLQGVASATNRLMQPGNYDRVVREALAILGEASYTDCVAIYQVVSPPDEADVFFVRQQHWMRDIEGEPRTPDFPERLAVREDGLSELYARLERYEMVNGSVDTLPELHAGLFHQVHARALMIAPIFIDVSLWGFIGLCDSHASRIWSREEASALQTMAASIGAAKQRENFELKLRHEREVADTLREVGTVLTSTLELDEMLARLLDQARRIVPFDSANVMLMIDDTARIVHCTGHDAFGIPLEVVRTVEFPPERSAYIKYIAEHRQPLLVRDVKQSAVWQHTRGSDHIRSWLGMPFLVRGEVVGLFALDSVTPGYFNDEHVRMLLPFAQQAGIAYENVRLYERQRAQAVELEARLEQLDALYTASQSILSTLELDVILKRFAEQITRLTRSTSTTICDFDQDTRSGVVQAVWPEVPWAADALMCKQGERIAFSSPLLEPATERHEVLRLTAGQARRAFPRKPALKAAHELIVVPIFSRARSLGVALLRDDPAHAFTQDDLQTCRALASQAAIAFEQALLFSDIRELERVKSEMIRLASHDLRGPLTRLEAYLEVISGRFETLTPERRQSYLRQAGETANEMQQIISELLSLERIEEQHRLAQPVVWADLINRALDTVRAELQDSQCALAVDCPPTLPDGRGDPVRLERALSNIVGNAIKYTPAGGQITVRGRAKKYGGQACVSIEVEDTGIGIPLDQQARLFEPFYRVEQAPEIPGLGLGLSVVKAAVTYHNGSVYMDSEPGRGSLFGFRVPV